MKMNFEAMEYESDLKVMEYENDFGVMEKCEN